MRLTFLLIFVIATAFVTVSDCSHTFVGTNVGRPSLYHVHKKYGPKVFRKRIEEVKYTIPNVPVNYGRVIQGIMAYDLTDSRATINVTQGGLGTNFVTLRMKSERGMKLDYDIYIYA